MLIWQGTSLPAALSIICFSSLFFSLPSWNCEVPWRVCWFQASVSGAAVGKAFWILHWCIWQGRWRRKTGQSWAVSGERQQRVLSGATLNLQLFSFSFLMYYIFIHNAEQDNLTWFGVQVINVNVFQEAFTGKKVGIASLSYRFTFQIVVNGCVIKESSLLKLRYASEVLKKNLILWVPDQFKWGVLRKSCCDSSDPLGDLSIPSSTWAE